MTVIPKSKPWLRNPVARVKFVPLDQVEANDYNPNAVAPNEMRLLYTSIKADGYTQPIVVVAKPGGEITFPCGHKSPLPVEAEEWSIIESHLLQLSLIQRGCLTEREVSVPLQPPSAPAGEFQSPKPHKTEAARSLNGSAKSGALGKPTCSEQATGRSGPSTSRVATKLSSSCELVCPTCMSNESERGKSWSSSVIEGTACAGASGVTVRWLTSKKTLEGKAASKSESSSTAQSMPSGQNALNLVYSPTAVIVDGFHRYSIMKTYKDIYEANGGMLPVVVIDKSVNERMAATVRHNRARGKHSVNGMAEMVFAMLQDPDYDDARICNELGLTPEELLRYKHVTGFSKLFENAEFSRAWTTARQNRLKREWKEKEDA